MFLARNFFFLSLQIIFNKIVFSQQFYSWVWTLVPEFNAENLKHSRIIFWSSFSHHPGRGVLLPSCRCAACLSADPWCHRRTFIICGCQVSAGHNFISHLSQLSWIVPLFLTQMTLIDAPTHFRIKSFHLLISSTPPSSNCLRLG